MKHLEAVEAVLQRASHPELKTPDKARRLAGFITKASRFTIFQGVLVMEWVHEPNWSVDFIAEPWQDSDLYRPIPNEQNRLKELAQTVGGDRLCRATRFHQWRELPRLQDHPEEYVARLNRGYLGRTEQQRFLGLILVDRPQVG